MTATGAFGVNAEVPRFTQALYEARELARMQAEAEQLDAEGIVGVQLNNLAHIGVGTLPSSLRSVRRCGRCVTTTSSPSRRWCYR